MGYALSVFLVPEHRLVRLFGKNDHAAERAALAALAEELADYDTQMHAPNHDDDIDLSHADALREIFAATFTPGVRGSRFGWALELLCGYLGPQLNNTGFVPCNIAWYEELDTLLAHHQIPLRFADLIYRAPLPIPPADDWPCVGHWNTADLVALDPLSRLLATLEDREVKPALETARGWLQAASEEPGSLIVGFHG